MGLFGRAAKAPQSDDVSEQVREIDPRPDYDTIEKYTDELKKLGGRLGLLIQAEDFLYERLSRQMDDPRSVDVMALLRGIYDAQATINDVNNDIESLAEDSLDFLRERDEQAGKD